jgi:hypothetical protein
MTVPPWTKNVWVDEDEWKARLNRLLAAAGTW